MVPPPSLTKNQDDLVVVRRVWLDHPVHIIIDDGSPRGPIDEILEGRSVQKLQVSQEIGGDKSPQLRSIAVQKGMEHPVVGPGKDNRCGVIVVDHGRPGVEKGPENPPALLGRVKVHILIIDIVAVDKIDDLILFGVICCPKHRGRQLRVCLIEGVVRMAKGPFVRVDPGVEVSRCGSVQQNLANPTRIGLAAICDRSPVRDRRVENMPCVVRGSVAVDIENITLLDTPNRLGRNRELLNISFPKGILGRFEKGQVNLIPTCGLFHLTDRYHRRRERGRLLQNLFDDCLQDNSKRLGIVDVMVSSLSIVCRILEELMRDGEPKRVGDNVLFILEEDCQIFVVQVLGHIIHIVRPLILIGPRICPVPVGITVVSDGRENRVLVFCRSPVGDEDDIVLLTPVGDGTRIVNPWIKVARGSLVIEPCLIEGFRQGGPRVSRNSTNRRMQVRSILGGHLPHFPEDVTPFFRVKDHRPESDTIGGVDVALDRPLGDAELRVLGWRIGGKKVEIVARSQVTGLIATAGRVELDFPVIKALGLQGRSRIATGDVSDIITEDIVPGFPPAVIDNIGCIRTRIGNGGIIVRTRKGIVHAPGVVEDDQDVWFYPICAARVDFNIVGKGTGRPKGYRKCDRQQKNHTFSRHVHLLPPKKSWLPMTPLPIKIKGVPGIIGNAA